MSYTSKEAEAVLKRLAKLVGIKVSPMTVVKSGRNFNRWSFVIPGSERWGLPPAIKQTWPAIASLAEYAHLRGMENVAAAGLEPPARQDIPFDEMSAHETIAVRWLFGIAEPEPPPERKRTRKKKGDDGDPQKGLAL